MNRPCSILFAAAVIFLGAVCLLACGRFQSSPSQRGQQLPIFSQPEKLFEIHFQNGLNSFSKAKHATVAPTHPPTGGPSPKPWSYEARAEWGRTCNTPNQSPIDIVTSPTPTIARFENQTVYLTYMQSKGLGIENDGHTIIGSGDALKGHKITVDSYDYLLKRFYFRRPSEHKIGGHRYPLELQLEHIAANGKTVMLSILFELGERNEFLDKLNWKHLPNTAGKGNGISSDIQMNDDSLIPAYSRHNWFRYYMYFGSMTFPPCAPRGWQNVRWVVTQTTARLSANQLSKFPFSSNARPTQPLNGRTIFENAMFSQTPTHTPTHTPTDAPTGTPTYTPTQTPTHTPTHYAPFQIKTVDWKTNPTSSDCKWQCECSASEVGCDDGPRCKSYHYSAATKKCELFDKCIPSLPARSTCVKS